MLIRGASGVGKSDLALCCLTAGWRLVADDRTLVWRSGGRLFAKAPARLSGLVEARGVGVRPLAALPMVELMLVADLVADPAAVERVPRPETVELMGSLLPRTLLVSRESSAPAKLSLALAGAAAGRGTLGPPAQQAYQAPRADEDGTSRRADGGPLKGNR